LTQGGAQIPKKIDRYEIIEVVGFGAMGAVYKAFDPLIKRPVAVKTLRVDVAPQSPDYKAFLERFQTEARTAGRLSHPNIITLYDVGHADGQLPWLAMEFIDGETVAELLEGEKLRPELVVGLVSQIASALDYAHGEGVIHRDIKPSNVIVFGGEKVKVADFGIAKLMDAEMTHSGLMLGTPSYMSPEQAMGEDLDGRTDIFSLGVVAFEMLSGQQPFPGNNVTSILYKLVHADPVRPDDLEVLGLLPDKWHEVFSRVLAKEANERFATAAEFVENLEHCLGSWFGALEGETIVMKDVGARFDAPPARSLSTPVESVEPVEPVEVVEPTGDALSDTVVLSADGAPAARGRDASLDGATMTLEHALVDLSADTNREARPSEEEMGEDTVLMAPPGDVEATLYTQNELDETIRAFDAADETVIQAPATRTAIASLRALAPKLRALPPKWLALGAGIFVAMIVALFLIFSGAEPSPDAVTDTLVVESGTLRVTTEPEGALVFLDGEKRGTTPFSLDALPLGDYALRVERSGYLPEELSASLTGDLPLANFKLVLIPAPAYLLVRSSPAGARVVIDGQRVGTTPTERYGVAPGSRVVRILRTGYLPWEDTVSARSGETIDIDVMLTRDGRAERRPAPSAKTRETSPAPAGAPVSGTLVERGDPGVVDPKCIECPAAPYPEAARRRGMEGLVELSYVIDETGAVRDVTVRESAGEIFDDSVTRAVQEWRYEPATKNGAPVRMRWVQRFRFRRGR